VRRIRVIPVLLIQHRKLVKTTRFKSPLYVGDPLNALRILNEKEVDEIVILDISATKEGASPDFEYIKTLAGECFMPLAYGGGITTTKDASQLFESGVEKVILGTAAFTNPPLIQTLARTFGSQSIVVSIDVAYDFLNRAKLYTRRSESVNGTVLDWIRKFESLGAGEIMLQVRDRDGTQRGFDLPLIRRLSEALTIPLVACSGASKIEDFVLAAKNGASAVAAGSMFLFKGPHKAVLINYPTQTDLLQKVYSQF
jgi:imidazole glycerol-phosphate synthase subunit HisF